MGNIGGGEILMILLVALIVLGPDKLPEAARQVGKVMGEMRKISSGFQREIQDAIRVPDEPTPAPSPTVTAADAVPADVVVEDPAPSGSFDTTAPEVVPTEPVAGTRAAAHDGSPATTTPDTTTAAPTPTADGFVSTEPAAAEDALATRPDPVPGAAAPAARPVISEAPPLPTDAVYGGDR